MTAAVLGDGRRRAVDRSQLGTMNHPMHRRPRRRPRKWNNHRRGPGDRYRSSETPAVPRRWAMWRTSTPELSFAFASSIASMNLLRSASSTVTLVLSADIRPQTLRQRLRNPERCSAPINVSRRSSVIHSESQTRGTPEPKTRGSETPGSKNPGLPAPGIASKPPTSPRTQRLPGVPVACPRSVPEPMLATFRLARYDDRSRAGRRSPTGGGPQPARNDEQSDAPEAATTSSKMEHSSARPR
jgi:hypothetical protein